MQIKLKILVLLFGFLSKTTWAVNIDLMVLYTNDFQNYNSPGLAIQTYIDYSNQAFVNSGMDIQFRVVHHQILEIPHNTYVSEKLLNTVVGDLDVMNLRNTYRPDIVVYLTRMSSTDAGIAHFPEVNCFRGQNPCVGLRRERALLGVSIVGWNDTVDTFPHEIGHNLGAGHGPVRREWEALGGLIDGVDRDHPGKPIASNRGHGVRDVFKTIMAYPDVFGTAPTLAYHSNPQVLVSGFPTGQNGRDNAFGMYTIASQYVQYYSSCYPAVSTTRGVPRGSFTETLCGTTPGYCLTFGEPIYVGTPGRGGHTIPNCILYNPN
jgi:peptidyl-Asp metalloendopeptidase